MFLVYWITVGVIIFISCLMVERRIEGEASVKVADMPFVVTMILLWPIVIIRIIIWISDRYKNIKIISIKCKRNK